MRTQLTDIRVYSTEYTKYSGTWSPVLWNNVVHTHIITNISSHAVEMANWFCHNMVWRMELGLLSVSEGCTFRAIFCLFIIYIVHMDVCVCVYHHTRLIQFLGKCGRLWCNARTFQVKLSKKSQAGWPVSTPPSHPRTSHIYYRVTHTHAQLQNVIWMWAGHQLFLSTTVVWVFISPTDSHLPNANRYVLYKMSQKQCTAQECG